MPKPWTMPPVKLKRLQSKLAELKGENRRSAARLRGIGGQEILQNTTRSQGGKQRRPAGIQTSGQPPRRCRLAPVLGGKCGAERYRRSKPGGANRGGGSAGYTRPTSRDRDFQSGLQPDHASRAVEAANFAGDRPEEFFEFSKRLEIGILKLRKGRLQKSNFPNLCD